MYGVGLTMQESLPTQNVVLKYAGGDGSLEFTARGAGPAPDLQPEKCGAGLRKRDLHLIYT